MRATLLLGLLVVLATAADAKLPPRPAETAVVSTGKAPCGLAVAGGTLLVGVYETGQLLRLDRTGRIVGRVAVGRWACQVAVGGGATWVTRDNANEVVRIDGSGRIRRVAISSPYDVTVAAGSAWVTSFETGTVTRLSLSGRRERVHRVGGHPTGIAACDQLFAYVADYILVCDKIPHDVRQHTRANMDGMNKMIRTKLMVDPDSRDELAPACTRGIAEAKQTYEENCK